MKKGKFEPGGFSLRVGRSRAGLGLFAAEAIPKDVCIIEYVGREISKEEEEKSRSKYLFEVSKRKTLDGPPRINKAGYINHSCRPNCVIEIRKDRVYVFSRRSIKPGEELNYDYDTDYFNEHLRKGGCRCDACREGKGRMGRIRKAEARAKAKRARRM